MQITKTHLVIGGAIAGLLLFSRRAFGGGKVSGAIPEAYRGLVSTYSQKHRISPALLAAIVQVESGWNPRAYRAEPRIKDASIGLGQILGGTARAYGFKQDLNLLYNPAINLDWTGHILASLMKKYGLQDAVAAYNAGSPKRDASGKYINQGYVDKVLSAYRKFS